MMEIPRQLQKKDFKFIKIKSKDKVPIEKWKTQNYSFDSQELQNYISRGGNYGVLSGKGNLIVIDADHPELMKIIEEKFEETFTIQTSKGKHYYYYSPEVKEKTIFQKNEEHYGELQTNGQYVVGPNSIHKTGKKYEVIKNINIQTIKFEQIKKELKEYMQTKEQKNKEQIQTITNPVIKAIKDKISVPQLMNHYGFDTSRSPTKCLWHDSKGNSSFKYTNDVWFCHHSGCEKGGDIFKLVMFHENCDFKKALETLAKMVGVTIPQSGNRIRQALSKVGDFMHLSEEFHKVQPYFYDRNRIWWLWNFDKYKWEQIDDIDLFNQFDEVLETQVQTTNQKVKNELIESLKRTGRKKIPEEIRETWIQFKHTIVNIKTGEQFLASPKYFVTNPIPWNIGKSEETPILDKLFEEWVGKKYVPSLYETIAFSLSNVYFIHVILCFIGQGSNGKTTFMGLLTKFLNKENMTCSDLDIIIKSRFEIYKLYKKLVCVIGEVNSFVFSRTSLLKRLTGQDNIGFEKKNKNPFDDINYAKIFIATNALPTTTDKTIGFYRRWLIIDFPNEFPNDKDILGAIPNEEYENLAKKSITILQQLWKTRKFTNEGDFQQKEEKYEEVSNPLGKFIDKQCIEDLDVEIPVSTFYNAFKEYLSGKKMRTPSKSILTKELKELGFEKRRTTITIPRGDGSNEYKSALVISGLILKEQHIESIKDTQTRELIEFERDMIGKVNHGGEIEIESLYANKPDYVKERAMALIEAKCSKGDWYNPRPYTVQRVIGGKL